MGSDPAYGGQGLPYVVNLAFSEMSSTGQHGLLDVSGPGLRRYSAIHTGGTDEQKQTYLPKMVTGEWTGTMNLTEPHCGTDLSLLRTKAVPQADGSYRITGQKIWISAGEHDMSDNIVHLVLARIEGAPAGVKGISLFIVPKFFPKADGSVGERNAGVKCVGLEEKMGIPRQRHLRHAVRRRRRLSDRRGERRPEDHVRHDERGAPGRRHAGRGPGRGRLPSRRRLRQGPPARPLVDRPEERRRPGRSDHRPPGRPPHAAGEQGPDRGRPRASCSGPPCTATCRTSILTPPFARSRRITWATDDAGAEGLPDRQGLFRSARTRCRCTAVAASPSTSRSASSCATAA
ncbi:acyl-CoA dehydrogenase family protein [Caulobacter segnis]